MTRTKRAWLVAATAAIGIGAPNWVSAAEEFYAGKTVTMLISFGSGGGYDTYARLAARHLGKHIPGRPNIIPQNMPGAGGRKGANYLSNVAPKDGSVLAALAEWAGLDQVLEEQGIRYDVSEINWIGRLTSTTSVYFSWHTSPSKTFEDVRNRETILGSSGRGLTAYLPRAMNRLCGAKLKLVKGYRGSRRVFLAMQQGELEAGFALWSRLKVEQAQLLRDGKINLLVTATAKRHSDLPDVPSLVELGRDREAKQILRHLLTGEIGRSVSTAPKVPSERVATLRAAFEKMVHDSDFLADAKKAKLHLDPLSGQQLQKIMKESASASSELRQKLRAAVRPQPAER